MFGHRKQSERSFLMREQCDTGCEGHCHRYAAPILARRVDRRRRTKQSTNEGDMGAGETTGEAAGDREKRVFSGLGRDRFVRRSTSGGAFPQAFVTGRLYGG